MREKIQRSLVINQEEISKNEEKYILCQLVMAMYDFNEKFKQFGAELMSIKDYPWLMNAIRTIMCLKTNLSSQRKARILLHKYEPELYRSWFLPNTSKNIENVTSGAALRLLKNNFQSVLNDWEEYLMDCKRHYCHKHVQRFVRATRWYKGVPIKFAKHCIKDLYKGDMQEMSSALIILSLLLDSNSLEKLINPRILARLETAMDKHKFVCILYFVKKFSN
jgi:hypothetical protein